MEIASVEVPAEVIDLIVNHLVRAEGLQQAWKLRCVCTTFASAIKQDVLLYQTNDVLFTQFGGNNIMAQLLPEYLYKRVRKPFSTISRLSARIMTMHSYICQQHNLTKEEEEDKLFYICAQMVQTVTVGALSDAIYINVLPIGWCDLHNDWCGGFDSGLTSQESVAAAKALSVYEVRKGLVPPLTEFDMALRLTSPLLVAVATDDHNNLRLITDHVVDYCRETLHAPCAMRLAMAKQSTVAVGCLAEIMQSLCWGGSRILGLKPMWVPYLREAVQVMQPPNVEMVRQIVLRSPNGSKSPQDIFFHACKTHNLDIVKILLSIDVAVDEGPADTALHVAIEACGYQTAVIGAVLDAGADIDKTDYAAGTAVTRRRQATYRYNFRNPFGSIQSGHLEERSIFNTRACDYAATMSERCCGIPARDQSPLEFAATRSMVAFEYLLERGATVRHVDFWYTISEEESFNALRDARIKQTGDKVPTFSESQDRMKQEKKADLQSEMDKAEKLMSNHRI